MNPSRQHTDHLWKQFLHNKASWKELQELLQYLQENPDNSYDICLLEDYLSTQAPAPGTHDEAHWKGKLQELLASPEMSASVPMKRKPYLRWVAAASLLTAAALVFWLQKKNGTNTNPEPANIVKKEERPILQQGAILTLADGRQILLDSAGNGLVSGDDHTKIYLQGYNLLYEQQSPAGSNDIIPTNTLSTPRGKQFRIDLPDGTRAWLNAVSSLTYPASFPADRREVSVTGEVFFEVAKTPLQPKAGPAIPFIVRTPSQIIEVLGTSFNVNCYEDEEAERTTLLQGAVRVSRGSITGNKDAILLKPGQQAVFPASGETSVHTANTDAVTDWQHGKFYFNNDNIQTIMRKISRLYDVEVTYQNISKTANTNFVGSVNKFNDVSEILRKLELTGTIKFKRDGKKILVIP
jgi:transmembrane sensor